MRVAVIGRGQVGGGLARRWRVAGHEVTTIGSDGGDVGDAEVVVVAIPGAVVAEGLARVSGLGGQITLDTTNDREGDGVSLVHEIKSIIGGPISKAFSTNFASLYDVMDSEPVLPGSVFASEPLARDVTEQLIRDAGLDPVYVGDLTRVDLVVGVYRLTLALMTADLGPFFYRLTRPGELSVLGSARHQ
jgi:8-hydroxy-5-deazaflavin:NADPH oxidoreductase